MCDLVIKMGKRNIYLRKKNVFFLILHFKILFMEEKVYYRAPADNTAIKEEYMALVHMLAASKNAV